MQRCAVLFVICGQLLCSRGIAQIQTLDPVCQFTFGDTIHCYELLPVAPVTWEVASIYASQHQLLDNPGHLASITSSAEHNFIWSRLGTNFPSAWLGGFQSPQDTLPSDVGWRWTTGEPWAYTSWSANEPNDWITPEFYLEMVPDGTWNDLNATRTLSALLIEWEVPNVGEAIDSSGRRPSFAFDAYQRPHVSFYDNSNHDLKYATTTSDAWEVEVVDDAGDTGFASSISIDGLTRPHIAYHDRTNGDLKYAYWDNGQWLYEVIDNSDSTSGYEVDMVLDSAGNPHVVYSSCYPPGQACPGELKYASKTDGRWIVDRVEPGLSNPVEFAPSLMMGPQDVLHLTYSDGTELKYSVRTEGGWVTDTIEPISATDHSSLMLGTQGNPHVVYSVNGNEIKYARRSVDVWQIETVAWGGTSPSLALDSNGDPVIMYHRWNGYGTYLARSIKAFPLPCSGPQCWTTEILDVQGGLTPALLSDGYGDFHVVYVGQENNLKYLGNLPTPTDTHVGPGVGALRIYPNPIRQSMTLMVRSAVPQSARVLIVDVRGRLVRSLGTQVLGAGTNAIHWDGRYENGTPSAAGVYFVRVIMGNVIHTSKLTLIR